MELQDQNLNQANNFKNKSNSFKQDQNQSDEEDQEDQSVDLIEKFAQAYKDNPMQNLPDQLYQNNGLSNIDENDNEDGDDENNPNVLQQSFKNTSIYNDIAKQIEVSYRQQNGNPDEVSCLNSFVPHQKSVFVLMNQKIEQDSIYDHTDNYNKTRFSSNLPQKYSKTNMPVTFHKKIKSSGYSGQPNSLKYSKTQKQKLTQPQVQYEVSRNFYSKPLPMGIPEELKILHEQPLHKNAITRLIYSPQGTKLASISQDTTISVIKTPMFSNKLELTSLGGHNGPVNSIHFSANDQYLISASADKRCIIWNLKWSKKGEKLLILDRLKKNKTSNETPQNQALLQQQNPPLPDAVRGAQFYYDDKLLTISCGNQLLFYQYELPDNPEASISKDDVKRLQQKGLYKLLQTYTHPTAQNIPSFHFHNHRLKTHIGLIGGSNKELIVYDANYNKPIAILNDGHQKHIHTVKFYEGSYGDSEAYNTFLTAAADNYIKLWDLRVGYPVREYGGYHQNRAIQIGFDISNCYRYLISGSEDRSVYVYDIGSGELIDKTKNAQHGDSVTDVAINPVYYEFATSSIDGHVRIFRYPAQKVVAKPKPKNGGGGLQVKGKKVDIKQSQQIAEYNEY